MRIRPGKHLSEQVFSLKKTLPRKVLQGTRHLKTACCTQNWNWQEHLCQKPFEKFETCVVKPLQSSHSLSWTARTMLFTGEKSDSLPMALPKLSAKRLHSLPFTLSTGSLLRKKKRKEQFPFLCLFQCAFCHINEMGPRFATYMVSKWLLRNGDGIKQFW